MSNNEIRESIKNTIESLKDELYEISLKIHDDPELGNQEYHACALLSDYLEKEGFRVLRKVAGLETSFMATFSNNSIGRRVGFFCEYDALPNVGHACGHNLITVQGLVSAISLKRLLEQNLIQGTVVLFGTPAEETTGGKVSFINHGIIQNSVDFAMMLHPFAEGGIYRRMLSLESCIVEFFGKSSNADLSPWKGVNAVDAIMQGFNNIAMLRQQILPSHRIHGIVTKGGDQNNYRLIPNYSSARITIRCITKSQVAGLKPKVIHCFEAAARATGCDYNIIWETPLEDVFMNDALALRYKHYMEAEGIKYQSRGEEEETCTGSTDMGNVSYVVPSIHPSFGIHTTAANHTKEFTNAARTKVAFEDTLLASQCQSITAADVFLDDIFFQNILDDFKKGKAE